MSRRTALLFVVSAPSGAGKTSLMHELLKSVPNLTVSVSHTTRAIRPGERDGVDYFFVDVPAFHAMVTADAFVEHAKVFDNYYGTSRAAVEQALAAGMDVILEIDWQGARRIRELYPSAISIFILPPSLGELRRRLEQRGEDREDVIDRRMQQAEAEISHCPEYEFVVTNEIFADAAADLRAIIRAAHLRQTPVR